jgi:hypothetical protein
VLPQYPFDRFIFKKRMKRAFIGLIVSKVLSFLVIRSSKSNCGAGLEDDDIFKEVGKELEYQCAWGSITDQWGVRVCC